MKTKTILIVSLLVLGVGMGIYNNLPEKDLVDCSLPPDVIYIKPSEIKYSSEILNNGVNRVVVIPEWNQVNAKTELLECGNFYINDYINLEWQN